MKTMFDIGDKVLVLATVTEIHVGKDSEIRYKVDMKDGKNPWGELVNFAVPETSIFGEATEVEKICAEHGEEWKEFLNEASRIALKKIRSER